MTDLDANAVFEEHKKKMMPRFIIDLTQKLEMINLAKDQKNFEDLRMIGHKIKGSCGMFGFTDLSEIGKSIEEEALKQNLSEISLYINQLEKAIKVLQSNNL